MPAKPERKRFACRVYHSDRISPAWLGVSGREIEWHSADELQVMGLTGSQPCVIIVDGSLHAQIESIRAHARRVIFVAADPAAEDMLSAEDFITVSDVPGAPARGQLLRAACDLACGQATAVRRRRYLVRVARAVRELKTVGLDLMLEHDEHRLLRRITRLGKRATRSDGAALLLARTDGEGGGRLELAYAEFDTIQRFETPLGPLAIDDSSIIGHAARTREPVIIRDAYDLPADASFVMDRSFDERYRYRRRSMMIVPMLDRRRQVVGVMVFVNRKSNRGAMITSREAADQYVLPYRPRELRVARALAGMAAVSIENARLHAQIERMLESFVKASVTAIDQRDPTTAGHSLRVATLSTALARAVARTSTGAYAGRRFTRKEMRELRYAALLHDFGKVAVREEVLVKAKKLPCVLWERVNARFDVILRTLELESCAANGGHALSVQHDGLGDVARLRQLVTAANEPNAVDRPEVRELGELGARTFPLPDGTMMPYLTDEELHFLRLQRGTLDDDERAQIEWHVEATHDYLVKIPWTDELRHVAEYAYGHHEKLDGSGYPRRLEGAEIPVQTRIITVVDIFDALTAADRPYRAAVSVDRALDILSAEAAGGLLDRDLVRVFTESRIHLLVAQDP